ncbi:uncharacterized protein L969DRAFT_96590 [Mixia osmundae IAM 14324]|uniref:Uncharacterized protein n=1 Tax=Mixia osmundae (strain CBS 9802 / IAM 14324 / JCM 22182 / KY 12970) TaxID=764103 RepID=G7EAW3_MIXOS|nr:uncharacterized protein L969DRAFT_96590 [Mixia osmundae IAM 14324]KEI37007.1 hypothetical protein L969DRAFT_96590 [Mixia osmundae IAM 14324]GAA99973.1 hypothetical protein E5Q_06676 [Mixia osmundae IAM 14324]
MKITLRLLAALTAVHAAPAGEKRAILPASPTVTVPGLTTFKGAQVTNNGVSIDNFFGIPFAAPPTGTNRLKPPQPLSASLANPYDATQQNNDCLAQQATGGTPVSPLLSSVLGPFLTTGESEDCLYLNVQRPSSASGSSKLPVMLWIYGGGFEFGGKSTYDGKNIVAQSVSQNQPVVYVALNYRLAGWGFLPGQEVYDAKVGNLGLQDQRAAMQWVNKNIAAFGGDPTKVTLFGESAGAISIGFQLLYQGLGSTQGLYRAVIEQSGSPIPVGPLSYGQTYFDTIANYTGCGTSSDKLGCLRSVSSNTYAAAVNQCPYILTAYRALALAFVPRVDGNIIPDLPQKLASQGKFAKVPAINGDNKDEGTLFVLSATNVSSEAAFKTYIKGFFPMITTSLLNALATAYPNNPTQGSPFGTGEENQTLLYENKRLAAILGDLVFQAPRRFISELYRKANLPIYSYLFEPLNLPLLGTPHATDILYVFGDVPGPTTQQIMASWISFATTLDPNSQTSVKLPVKWLPRNLNGASNQIVFGPDGVTTLGQDTYPDRSATMAHLLAHAGAVKSARIQQPSTSSGPAEVSIGASSGVAVTPGTATVSSAHKRVVQQSTNNILVSTKQKGNRCINHITVPWEHSDIMADFQVGTTTGVLFLSIKYHKLEPAYIYGRIEALGQAYNLRILLVQVDADTSDDVMRELTRISITNAYTIMICSSSQEAGRILSKYKKQERRPPDALKARPETDYLAQMQTVLTKPRAVNKTDTENLIRNFGSLKDIMMASSSELVQCPGLGELKVRRLRDAFSQPFLVKPAKSLAERRGEEGSSLN